MTEEELSPNARRVLAARYLQKDERGALAETPAEMFQRVARHIAAVNDRYGDRSVEADERAFYRMMRDLDFLPNSPTLMNAGTDLGQLAVCFVLPIEDSLVSIYETLKNTALIHQSGGGTGFSFSRLRPKGDRVRETEGVASGPVSFMRVYDASTEAIKQGGRRRGANMAVLSVDHPDICAFITSKLDPEALANFNISVAIDDDFMDAVANGDDYALINPRTNATTDRVDAAELFDVICVAAHRASEPGVLFLDGVNADNPTPEQGAIESTNPCGEQPLLPYEACILGSINLSHFLLNNDTDAATGTDADTDAGTGSASTARARIDYRRLGATIETAVRFLDNAIDASVFPVDAITTMVRKNRKIGLGVMGFADLLVKLRIPYDSPQALQLGHEVMHFITDRARAASATIAETRGAFFAFGSSIYADGAPLRNATCTTVAPTGTIRIIAGCSSGIEPLYALSYTREALDGETLVELNRDFVDIAHRRGFFFEDLIEKVRGGASIQQLRAVPEDVRRVFATSLDIAPKWHVRVQAVFQHHTDNAVSKTINLPETASVEEVRSAFLLAYELGCKGITIYRQGTRKDQVMRIQTETGTMEGEEAGSDGEGADGEGGAGKPRPSSRVCGQCD